MSQVIDFNKRKEESIEQRKRAFERVLFKDFLVSSAEIDDHGNKYDIDIVNISQTGLQFQALFSKNVPSFFKEGNEVLLRVYFTTEDYLPVTVQLKHCHEYIDDKGVAYWRAGGEFDRSLPSFQAMKPFIDFIYKFAEYSCVDKGESKVYFL